MALINMSKFSICIPCYEMQGRGLECLDFSLERIFRQTLKDIEVVISDDSENDKIEKLCSNWSELLNIKYIKNQGKKGSSANANNAIQNASGEIIKILCQDDYFIDSNSLQLTLDSFDFQKNWLVSSYWHSKDHINVFRQQIPKWNNRIYFDNTIGTHSSLSFINKNPILFDENLSWYMDCEYYFRLFLRYGEPQILEDPTVVQLLWPGQVTNTLVTDELVRNEQNYIMNKYKNLT